MDGASDAPIDVTNDAAAKKAGDSMDKYKGVSVGNVVDCEGGYLTTASYFTAQAFDREGKLGAAEDRRSAERCKCVA